VTGKIIGLTTGQAARYCLVSADTIANWIRAKQLPAQRTIGGQYRILVNDLRQFMTHNAMSTALLDAEVDCRPYCWEHQPGGRGQGREPSETCRQCPAYRTKALDCFALRAISPDRNWSHGRCQDCAYFQKWAGGRSNECNP
jgi:excisionase family DNA binding protein